MSFRDEILKRVEKADDLPTLPGVFTEIQQLISSEKSSANDIAAIMQDDPAMTTKILKVANSAAFGGSEEITSVSQAISRMGFQQTGNIAMSLSMLGVFEAGGMIDYFKFWKHSLAVAQTGKLIPKHMERLSKEPNAIFTSGLLHDVGVFLLDQYGGDLYHQVLSMVQGSDMKLHECETQIMGINHSEIGALLLHKWNIPDNIVDAISNHHKEYEGIEHMLQTWEIVSLADNICNCYGEDNGVGDAFPELTDSDWIKMDFKPEVIPAISAKVHKIIEESAVIMAAV